MGRALRRDRRRLAWTDIMFAVDSIPAIFAITQDPFIIYTSNIFTIIGLRALFFVLSHAMNRFVYLKQGVGTILAFVGLKIVLSWWIHIPIGLSLGMIVLILVSAIVFSILKTRREPPITADLSIPGGAAFHLEHKVKSPPAL